DMMILITVPARISEGKYVPHRLDLKWQFRTQGVRTGHFESSEDLVVEEHLDPLIGEWTCDHEVQRIGTLLFHVEQHFVGRSHSPDRAFTPEPPPARHMLFQCPSIHHI